MRPSFHPKLINNPFSDPGLFIPFLFKKRALMFDLGDLTPLSSKDLLKLTHVFVTHTHIDHFIGFDTLLRVLLGRDKELHLFGPTHFFEQVEGKLSGYTWNLLDTYLNHFQLKVTEVHPQQTITRTYSCQEQFHPLTADQKKPFSGILLQEPSFFIQAALLDHRIPCLGLSLVENYCVNIIKEGLKDLDLPVGPWLNRLKQAIYEKVDMQGDFVVTWEEKGKTIKEKTFVMADLVKKMVRISPGQKITYITDVVDSSLNREKIIHLAKEADHLFIEATFLNCDADIARKKYHLTAKAAGELAREANVKRFTLFHFSPRYTHTDSMIYQEAMKAFQGTH